MKEKHEDNKDDDDHKFQNTPGKWTMNKWTNDEHRWLHITYQMAMRKKWLVLLPFKDRDVNQLEESFRKVIKGIK